MKSNNLKAYSLLAAAGIALAGCGGLGKMAKNFEDLNNKVNPDPLIVQGDSVALNITGKIPANYFHKKVLVDITPSIEFDGKEKQFKVVSFQGESAVGNGTVVKKAEGKSYNYSDKVAFASGMEQSEVFLSGLGKQGSKTKDLPKIKIATGVITTPFLVQSDDKVMLAKDKFARTTNHTLDSEIKYLVNSSEVRSTELRTDAFKELQKFTKDNAKNEAIQFESVVIKAYASPEGELSLNDKLADNRAKSAKTVVEREFKNNKIKTADNFYKLEPKGEDWEGFKKLMQASNIKDKDLILRVLEMYTDNAKREQEIRNLAETFLVLKEEILPPLRRSQIQVAYAKVGKTDEEISTLAKTNPESLNVEEILYAATLTEDINEKLRIYQAAEKNFANDHRASNNVGYIFMLQNKVAEAEAQFEKSNNIKENSEANNNLGVIARLKGDRKKAASLFAKAGSASEAKYNMGIVNIQDGKYADAISNMGSAQTFNVALAKLLNGDTSGASNALSNSTEKDSAEGFYLAAIIGARNNDSAMALTNLKKAIDKDGSLKSKAAKDLEFRNLFSNSEFKNIVN
ncbi:MAG: TPR end-of-group domain-containing protein [Luteibaculaceae bacterium]